MIVSLETVLDSEEKYISYSYEYPTTMLYHDFLTLIEDSEENFIERISSEIEEEEKDLVLTKEEIEEAY